MPPFGGPLPPALTGAPPGAGPATVPSGKPGMAMDGISKVRMGLQALQEALPSIPMGTELHTALMKSIEGISKRLTEHQDSPQMQVQQLLGNLAKIRASQPTQALAGMMGRPGGAPPPGGNMPPPNLGGGGSPEPSAMAA